MIADFAELLQDRNGDGVADYLNARIFVADNPTPPELAAAANIAARLGFETLSLDLPIGFPISAYDASDTRFAIVVGRPARNFSGPSVIAIPDLAQAERFARTASLDVYRQARSRFPSATRLKMTSLARFFSSGELTVILGPDVRATAVIDLAARIGLEATRLTLPLVLSGSGHHLPRNAVLIGRTNPHVPQAVRRHLKALPAGHGRIELALSKKGETAVVIAGADDEGEAEAIRHAALRLPFVWDYGKENPSLSAVEVDIQRQLSHGSHRSKREEQVIFDIRQELDWEVDDALQRIRDKVLPHIKAGAAVNLEIRLSEPATVRRELEAKIVDLLAERGADRTRALVRVLSAYKQGYAWIDEVLRPGLRNAHKVTIRFRALPRRRGFLDSPIRWLQELYPIDEVLARDLGIPLDNIRFEQAQPDAAHIYEVLAKDSRGRMILREEFDPSFVRRPLFDRFPAYASALVTTGWITATIDGVNAIDERIETDPERFWGYYQKDVLSRLAEHITGLYGGPPRSECKPHFGELIIEVGLSEPNYRIGIDEERISSLEALHEDIYFETLLFLDVLGLASCGHPLTYAGRIIPKVRLSTSGPGRMRVLLTGKTRPGRPHVKIDAPAVTGVTLRKGQRSVVQLDVRVKAPCRRNELPAARFGSLDSMSLVFNDRVIQIRSEPAGSLPSHPQIVATAGRRRAQGEELVQWDSPIGPSECEAIIKRLAVFPEVRPYLAGTSYLGRSIWAMDVVAPVTGRYFSESKASAAKPVLFITGRQHANEVSSSSHILRLVELLATDAECRKLLNRVNFVIHPITNPDGAALVEELHQLEPGFMLHACYFGALGVDVTDGQWDKHPFYPEALVRPEICRAWKPDVLLNPHGYPSHEWIQLFAGYSAWVRSRTKIARDWWIPRGWFIPKFQYRLSESTRALALLGRVLKAMAGVVGPLNMRMYRRYAKYARFQPATPPMRLHRGIPVHKAPMKRFSSQNVPLDIVTEVPDEVASGDWLKMTAQAGLEFSLATARFLAETSHGPRRRVWRNSRRTVFVLSRGSGSRDW